MITDMARSLGEMGHHVTMYSPDGTWTPSGGRQLSMPCAFGAWPPSSEDCEDECYRRHSSSLMDEDIVHDFSVSKRVVSRLRQAGRPGLSTLMGGAWTRDDPPVNLCVWTLSHRDRVLRGATDYEGTSTPDLAGPPQKPVREAHVVHGAVDTDWYSPSGHGEDFILWMNRWHPAKGYAQAIFAARRVGFRLMMAGEHPDRELFQFQRDCALEAVELARGLKNVEFVWLPPDPDHHVVKRELYRRASALLYSVQFHEPFGLSQVEAMSCGTPVVGTAYGSVPEVVTDGVTGYVSHDLDGSLRRFLKDPSRLSRSACREDAVNRFDRRVMARSYLEEYRKAVSGETW